MCVHNLSTQLRTEGSSGCNSGNFPPFWLKWITEWIRKAQREHRVCGFIKQCKPNIIKPINSPRFKSGISTAEIGKALSVTFKAVWVISSTQKGPVQEHCLQCFQGLHVLRDLWENTQNFSMAPPLAGSYAQCIFILIPNNSPTCWIVSLANQRPISLLIFVRIPHVGKSSVHKTFAKVSLLGCFAGNASTHLLLPRWNLSSYNQIVSLVEDVQLVWLGWF